MRTKWMAAVVMSLAAGAEWGSAQVAGPRLEIELQAEDRIQLRWPGTAAGFVPEETASLDPAVWAPLTQPPLVAGGWLSVILDLGDGTRYFRLRSERLTTVVESSPASGEQGVAVTRETIVRFSAPLAPSAVLSPNHFYAGSGGRRLLSRVELSSDRLTATLFYLEPLPGNARIHAVFDGAGLSDAAGLPLDPDGDGLPGGLAVVAFDTVSVTPVAGTAVYGRVLASELVPGPDTGTNAVNRPLAGVTITVDGAEERLRAVTDAQGNFRLDPAPAGTFFVHIDGRTAVGSQWPDGAYYPFVGKAWEGVVGRATPAAGTGEVYLPLIASGTLQSVSAVDDTVITFPASVLAKNPALEGVSVTVPANALFSDNGARGGKVGIAPVPPDRLPGPLPPGLSLPIVITVQTDGPLNFDSPVAACFPNLPDPVTGQTLPPGARSALVSFNHDLGEWEVVGPATVSADGRLVCTDPGVGIRSPGWHGTAPGCPGVGADGPAKAPDTNCPDADTTLKIVGKNYCGLAAAAGVGGFLSFRVATAFLPGGSAIRTAVKFAIGAATKKGALDAAERGQYCAAFFGCCLCKVSDAYTSYCDNCDAIGIPRRVELDSDPPDPHLFAVPANAAEQELEALFESIYADLTQHQALSDQVFNLIGNATKDEELSSAQLDQLRALTAQLQSFLGNRTPLEFYGPRLDRFEALLAEAAPSAGELFSPERARFSLEDLDRGLVQRGLTRAGGAPPNLILRPDTTYRLRRYFASTGRFGEVQLHTPGAGLPARIPMGAAVAASALGPDTDSDGLPDLVESVLGTAADDADTDHDGVSDGAEVAQGTDPLDGLPAATGVIANTPTVGPALDVAAFNNVAVVAEGDRGVGVFNIFNGTNPILVAQVDTPGIAGAVALGGAYAAVADGPAGLAILDLRDPPSARLSVELSLGTVRAVAASGSLAFAGLDAGQLVAVDLATGEEFARVSTGAPVEDVSLEGDAVYVLTEGELQRYLLIGSRLEFRQRVAVSRLFGDPIVGRKRLQVGGGEALVTRFSGFEVIDTRDPEVLQPAPAVFRESINSFKQIVQNGSGLGVAAVGVNPRNDGTHDVWLYDLSNPRTNLTFLATIPTPGIARALTIYNGLAYVADDTSGLAVVNYLAYDTHHQAPTIRLETPFTEGLAEEGQNARITAVVSDDVQVRNVEFYLDGRSVAVDGNFPFEARFGLSRLTATKTNIVLQARATDTGGNSTLSEPLTLTLRPDATPPTLLAFTPSLNALLPPAEVDTLSATFSEGLDPATVTSAGFGVVSAGPDGELGTADDSVVGGATVAYRADRQTVVLKLPTPLAEGRYAARLMPTLRDPAGNPVAPFTWELRIATPVRWIRDGDGFWDVAANWSSGVVPQPNDFVVIDRPGGQPTVTYRSGDLTLARLTCAGSLVVAGGQLNLLQPSRIAGDFTLTSGRFGGPGDLEVAGRLQWQGGEMRDAARTIVSGNLTVSGAENKVSSGRTIELRGSGVWRDSGGLVCAFGATLAILPGAMFTAENDSVVSYICCLGAGPAVQNYGTFRKLGSTGLTRIESGVLNNFGVVEVASGTLRIGQGPGGVSTGRFDVSDSATLEFAADNYQVNPGSSFSGAGWVRQTRGQVTLSTDVTMPNLELADGILTGPGRLTLGTGRWVSGNFTGNGTVEVPAGATLAVSGDRFRILDTRVINNGGTILYDGSNVAVVQGGTINNLPGALFELRGDGGLGYICCVGAGPILNNAGVVRKSAGVNASQFNNLFLDNQGLVEVQSGRIELINGSGTQRGTVRLEADTVLKFDGGTYVFSGAAFAGDGLVRCNADLTVQQASMADHLELFGNRLRGPAPFTVTQTLDWTGGDMVGPAVTEIAARALVSVRGGGGKALDGRTVNNAGTLVWTDDGGIAAYNGAVFNNLAGAVFEARNNAGFGYVCCVGELPTFNNSGVLRKTGGTNATTLNGVVLNNAGTIEVATGRVECRNGGGLYSGTVHLGSDTVLLFDSGNPVLSGASFVGGGWVRGNADVTVQLDSSAEQFELFGNRLRGPANFTVTRTLDWSGGEMVGPAVTQVAAGATATVRGNGGKSLDGRTVNNAGTVLWIDSGGISGVNGATINNLAGAVFELRSDAGFGYVNFVGATPSFNNDGTFRKTTTTGTSRFYAVAFVNRGVMEIQQGTLELTQPFTQMPSGTLAVDIGGLAPGTGYGRLITGGPAALAGTFAARLANGYAPNVGDTFGVLTYASRTGQFDAVNGRSIGNGLKFVESYGATVFALQVQPE